MTGKNHEVLAMAFKRAKGKTQRIEEAGITPDFTKEQINEMIVTFADKLLADPTYKKSRNEAIKGQRWYVEDLVKFSGLEPQEKLDTEYENSFADIAGEDEMVAALAKMSA